MPNLATTGAIRLVSTPGASPQPSWTPLDLTGNVVYYDGADAATITADGSFAMSQWNNKYNPGTYDLTQGTGSAQPHWNRTVNGHTCPDFDGSADFMAASYNQAQPFTRWAVVVSDGVAGGSFEVIADSGVGGGPAALYRDKASNTWRIYALGSEVGTTTADTSVHLLVGVFNGASSSITTDGSAVSGNAGGEAQTGLRLGVLRDGSSFWNGAICAFGQVTGTMSAGDQTLLRSWAQSYWGTP